VASTTCERKVRERADARIFGEIWTFVESRTFACCTHESHLTTTYIASLMSLLSLPFLSFCSSLPIASLLWYSSSTLFGLYVCVVTSLFHSLLPLSDRADSFGLCVCIALLTSAPVGDPLQFSEVTRLL
jgi:hypothetical protein